MFRKALFIFSGNTATSVLTLLRNLLVARLISVEDYGIASTYAIAMTLVEMISTLGMQQQIIQDKNGDDPRFQAGLQGFNVLRGAVAALVLFVSAQAIADFMGIPEIAWAYQVLALVPLFNSLQNFDIHRLTRQMNYRPFIAATALPALISLLTVWPLWLVFSDHRVMLYAILVQMGLMMAVSHLMAERRFQMRLDRGVVLSALKFGWPLLINNLLLFAVFNGDRVIVGRELGMEPLAILAMGFTLTLTPTLVLANSAQNFFLPQLAALQGEPARFEALAMATLQAVFTMALLFLFGLFILGGPFVNLVLGETYAALPPLLMALGILQVVRVMKAGGAIAALARGQTSNAMWANLARLLVLPVVWIAANEGWGLMSIIWLGVCGETLGLTVSLWLLTSRLALPLKPLLPALIAMGAVLVVAAIYSATLSEATAGGLPGLLPALLGTILVSAAIWTMQAFWTYVRQRQMTGFET